MRMRSIKPAFFANDRLAKCTPMERLLFVGLWCYADCAGRLLVNAPKIKAAILPHDECDVVAMLTNLQTGGFVTLYEADGKALCQINTFGRHQRLSGSEAQSQSHLPAPHGLAHEKPVDPQKPKEEEAEEKKEEDEQDEVRRFFPRRPVEIPPLKQILVYANVRGIPKECAEKWWAETDGRGGLDRYGNPILRWQSSLQSYFIGWRSTELKTSMTKTPLVPPHRPKPTTDQQMILEAQQ